MRGVVDPGHVEQQSAPTEQQAQHLQHDVHWQQAQAGPTATMRGGRADRYVKLAPPVASVPIITAEGS